MPIRLVCFCLLGAALLSWHMGAAARAPSQQQNAPQQILVHGIRAVDQASYRKIFSGMQVFRENRQLAPAASLRYRLYPRAADATFEGLTMTLVADGVDIPVPVDAGQFFDLPEDAAFARAGASLMTNQKDGAYAWRVDIRTPGLSPNTRRLGDLRLECKVDTTGAHLRNIILTPAIALSAAVGDPCMLSSFENPFFADHPVFNVTLVSGTRRESIAADWMYANSARFLPDAILAYPDWRRGRDRQYIAALSDSSWPDSTLLYFDYMDDLDNAVGVAKTGERPGEARP